MFDQMWTCAYILLPNKEAITFIESLSKLKDLIEAEAKQNLQMKVNLII